MKVRLSDYNLNWKVLFERECKLLFDILKDEVVRFEHFGSTAVRGMKAKPVIDMMVLVKDISTIDTYNSIFEVLGYDVAGEWGIPGRRLLRKGGENRSHHIHIYQYDHPEIYRHLAVRDYLLKNLNEVYAYSAKKEELAEKYEETRAYSKAKKGYVMELEKRALKYFEELDGYQVIKILIDRYDENSNLTENDMDQLINEMMSNIGHPDPDIRDALVYSKFCEIILNGKLTVIQIRNVMKECLDNLTYRINEKNNDNVFKRSFSALFLHAIVYSDNQEKFLSEMEYNVLIKGSIDYFINEKDVRGFVDGKGWAHAPAHTSDLIVECIKSQYYMKNFNGEILEGIEINLARLQNDYIPYIDDEEMRMSHIVIELLEKSLVTEQYIVDWIKLIKNKLETTKVKDIIYYRKAKNLNDFIKSLYFGAKNHPVLQKMLITLIES